jgi:hypothetical protein
MVTPFVTTVVKDQLNCDRCPQTRNQAHEAYAGHHHTNPFLIRGLTAQLATMVVPTANLNPGEVMEFYWSNLVVKKRVFFTFSLSSSFSKAAPLA